MHESCSETYHLIKKVTRYLAGFAKPNLSEQVNFFTDLKNLHSVDQCISCRSAWYDGFDFLFILLVK